MLTRYRAAFEIPAERVPSMTPARFYYSGLEFPSSMVVHCVECGCDEETEVMMLVPVILGLN